jgi:pyruvate/2-oxoglutarate dehydrogenase complex dihydrolipoamide dehydrogenase (E3) component
MLRGLDDALALQSVASCETLVAIVGAGFIGCEVAATLPGLGVHDVTRIEMAPNPMPVLGPVVGARANRGTWSTNAALFAADVDRRGRRRAKPGVWSTNTALFAAYVDRCSGRRAGARARGGAGGGASSVG